MYSRTLFCNIYIHICICEYVCIIGIVSVCSMYTADYMYVRTYSCSEQHSICWVLCSVVRMYVGTFLTDNCSLCSTALSE